MSEKTGQKGGILKANFTTQSELYAAFMPFLRNGGLFIKTNDEFTLGDEVFVLINLPNDAETIPLAARVAWIMPKGSSSHPAGVGIHFADENREIMNRIESLLADQLKSKNVTLTM